MPSHSGVTELRAEKFLNSRPFSQRSETMLCPSTIVVLCGMVLLRTPLLADAPSTYHITMNQAVPSFSPVVASVQVGYRIQWNNTATAHTVTHDDCLTKKACVFDSGSVAPMERFSLSLLQPGIYHYYCRLHPIMRGTIMVRSDKVATRTH